MQGRDDEDLDSVFGGTGYPGSLPPTTGPGDGYAGSGNEDKGRFGLLMTPSSWSQVDCPEWQAAPLSFSGREKVVIN